jgi:hypothetical protein
VIVAWAVNISGESAPKKKFPRELYRRTCSVCISNGKSLTDWPSVIVAWAVNILELSVNYRRIYFVGNISSKHRRIYSIGDCGMGGNFFTTFSKIPTTQFRL